MQEFFVKLQISVKPFDNSSSTRKYIFFKLWNISTVQKNIERLISTLPTQLCQIWTFAIFIIWGYVFECIKCSDSFWKFLCVCS